MWYLFIFFLGLIFGSFISALTYRLPKGIDIKTGRSFCPNCKKKINWFDNIPLLSFLLLRGKCRNCKKIISVRYPIIELTTALCFMGVLYLLNNCFKFTNIFCSNIQINGFITLPYFLFLTVIFIALFIIDLEHQLLPDNLIFFALLVVWILLFLFDKTFYFKIFAGFIVSFVLYSLYLITKGKGMGLGDVKFVILGGSLIGWPYLIVWLFISFILGGFYGILMVILKKVGIKDRVAFGPFLIIGLIITLLLPYNILNFYI